MKLIKWYLAVDGDDAHVVLTKDMNVSTYVFSKWIQVVEVSSITRYNYCTEFSILKETVEVF